MTTETTTTGTRHETTAQIRASLRERGWTNVARVTIDGPAGVIASPRISMAEFKSLLTNADSDCRGRLVVQEDRHVTMYDTPDPTRRTRTFFVYGYQPEAQT